MNSLNGYQQLRCDWVADDGYLLLSHGAGGALLFLRLMADRSRFESRIFGAICGEHDLWTAEDAILAIAEREVMAGELDQDSALQMAGKWVYDLRDAGMVSFGSDQAILIVQAYCRDMGQAQRNKARYGLGEGQGTVDVSRAEKRQGGAAGRGGASFQGNVQRPRVSAGQWPRPAAAAASSPPVGAEDGNGGRTMETVGGKGGLYSAGANQTKLQTKLQTQSQRQTPYPNQTIGGREDAVGGGEDAAAAA